MQLCHRASYVASRSYVTTWRGKNNEFGYIPMNVSFRYVTPTADHNDLQRSAQFCASPKTVTRKQCLPHVNVVHKK